MCIIVLKEKNKRVPRDIKTMFEACFENNPDGAGIMWVKDGAVHIEKGLMTFNTFWDSFEEKNFKKSDTFSAHFRIGTHGGLDSGKTHPFPISSNIAELNQLKISYPQAVVHNGIITGFGTSWVSDTQEFIRDVLSLPHVKRNLWIEEIQNEVLRKIDSKMVIFEGDGSVYKLGTFIRHNGLLFSNSTFSKVNWYNYYTASPRDYYDYDVDTTGNSWKDKTYQQQITDGETKNGAVTFTVNGIDEDGRPITSEYVFEGQEYGLDCVMCHCNLYDTYNVYIYDKETFIQTDEEEWHCSQCGIKYKDDEVSFPQC